MEGTGYSRVWDVFLNEMSEPCLVGFFADSVDFDPGPEILKFNSVGSTDGFILSLSTDGNLLWVQYARGENTLYITDLFIDVDQKTYVMGGLRGDMDFGSEVDEHYLDYSGFP
jgi:hypothetical protein